MTDGETAVIKKFLTDIGQIVGEKLPKGYGIMVIVTELTKNPTVLHYSNMSDKTSKAFLTALSGHVDGGAFDA